MRYRSSSLVALVVLLPVQAFAQSSTSGMLDLLKSIDPSERASLQAEMGLGSVDNAAATAPAANLGTSGSLNFAQSLERQQQREKLSEEGLYKPSDTVIVEINLITNDIPARTVYQGIGAPPLEISALRKAIAYTPLERAELDRLIDLIRARNPYKLDNDGALVLPGFGAIALSGLNDEQATRRLSAEPSLLKLETRITKLPLQRVEPFGYRLFKQATSPFGAATTNALIPNNYIVGVGDELRVQLYGSKNSNLRMQVSRDGVVNFPELGPVSVVGQSFSAVSADIEARVAKQIIGTKASVSLSNARSIQVFVLGEANKPGSYPVSGLASITSALFAAGGVKEGGSLRDIQLKRRGVVLQHLDLYSLLLKGDTRDDVRLAEGDVVFIPPVGPTVTIEGEVRRSAIYELRGNANLAEVIALAGGVTPNADLSRVVLNRIDEQQRRVVLDITLRSNEGRSTRMSNGDALRILPLRPVLDSAVVLAGHLYRPGLVAWRAGLRLTDVLPSLDDLKPNADTNYVLIRREAAADRRITMLSASLTQALRDPSSKANPELGMRDQIIVLDVEGGRRQLLEPVLSDLRRQSSLAQPTSIVTIGGQVKAPGEYPLEISMRVSDLLRAGGQLQDSAFGASAELSRRRFNGERWETELFTVDLAAVNKGDVTADTVLEPGDNLIIKQAPEWSASESVTLAGEVRFPGLYPIRRGETLRSVIERAGGLSVLANAEGTVFTRAELRELEQREILRLSDRLQRDLAASALQNSQSLNANSAATTLPIVQAVLAQLKDVKPVGRLVIDMNKVLNARLGSSDDIALRSGDQVLIPKMRQEVSVIGEVQNVSAHLYRAGWSASDYLELSGGTNSRADEKRIFVVRADGSVKSSKQSLWFGLSSEAGIRPGDTIVVPLDTESLPTLAKIQLWQSATGILYNSAIAIAAFKSL